MLISPNDTRDEPNRDPGIFEPTRGCDCSSNVPYNIIPKKLRVQIKLARMHQFD